MREDFASKFLFTPGKYVYHWNRVTDPGHDIDLICLGEIIHSDSGDIFGPCDEDFTYMTNRQGNSAFHDIHHIQPALRSGGVRLPS